MKGLKSDNKSLVFQILNGHDKRENRDIVKSCYDIAVANGKLDGSIRFPGCAVSNDILIAALQNGQVVAYAALMADKLYYDPEKGSLTLMSLAVDPNLKHKGIGTQILNYVTESSKTFERMYSNFHKTNTQSVAFHAKAGFKVFQSNKTDDFAELTFDGEKQKTAAIRESYEALKQKDDTIER